MEVQHHHHHTSSPCSTTGAGRFNFISAPTSPSRESEFYRDLDDFSEQEFAFHVTTDNHSRKTPVSADELFDRGRIRSPMAQQPNRPYNGAGAEPPMSVQIPLLSPFGSPKPIARKSFWTSFAPKSKIKPNPFAERGRGWGPPPSTSASGRRATRSLSPTREEAAPAKSSRRWKLTDFLLFRSASEGRASDKDPMRKLTSFYRRSSAQEELKASINKNAQIRRSGQPVVSAHERHYTANKAVSEDLKKKTFLPYKQGILGRLAVNPNVHALAHSRPLDLPN